MQHSSSSLSIGSCLPYPWPKTVGFFTTNQSEVLAEAILLNDEFVVSEKIDGCNISVSTQGWISSRQKIIAFRDDDLSTKKFHQVSLKEFDNVFKKLDEFKKEIETLCSETSLHIILYGELVLKGTASSPFDIYNYKEKEYNTGEFYIFGIGIVDNQTNDWFPVMENNMKRIFNNVQVTLLNPKLNETLYTSMLGPKSVGKLDKFGLKSVRFLFKDHLQSILTNPTLVNHLKERKTEGFVLHNSCQTFKFKYIKNLSKFRVRDHLHMMENYLKLICVNYDLKETFVLQSLDGIFKNDQKWINSCSKRVIKNFIDTKVSKYDGEIKNGDFCLCEICLVKSKSWLEYFILFVYNKVKQLMASNDFPYIDKSVELEIQSKIRSRFQHLMKIRLIELNEKKENDQLVEKNQEKET